ncbi:MAG: DMT family transporter [Peptococcales bacterium]|jgi:drug/metabolite transporter (DMT)-like permease
MSGVFYALLVAYGYASSNIYMKKGMENGSKDIGVFITLIVNFALALPFAVYVLFKNPDILNFSGIFLFIISGILGPILGRLTFYTAINHVPITVASSIKITAPFFAAIIAFLLLGETLSIRVMLGMLIVIFALYQLSKARNDPNKKSTGNALKLGITFALLSALSFASGNVIRKFSLQYIDSAVLGLAISTFSSLIFYLIYLGIKGRFTELKETPPEAGKNFIIGGIFTTIATFCYFLALKTIPVAITVTLANIEPIFVMLLGRYIYKLPEEKLNGQILACLGMIFLGILIITFKG